MKNNILIPVFLLFILFTLKPELKAQDVNSLFREAERFESEKNDTEALKKYLEIIRIQPLNIQGLCKTSELYSNIGSRQQSKSLKLDYFKHARHYAETALKLNPAHADANFVMALAMGRMALVLNGQEKINAVNDIKRYAENAIKADANNYKAYHMLGKWHYEISSLNSFERAGVKLMFGAFPSSSFAESIRLYEKSRAINPGFALNYLELAKAYHKNDQDNKAIEILKKLQTLPITSTDDPRIKKEGNSLLQSLQD